MSRRTKGLLASLLVVPAGVVAAAIAIAQTGGSGSSPERPESGWRGAGVGDSGSSAESPESGVRGVGLPEGPFVDFCPTPEQVELHLKVYGFDYKPTVACTREGEPPAPSPEQVADTARDPDEGFTTAERIARLKQELLASRPAPDADGDPLTIEGVSADGRRFALEVSGDPDFFRGMTPQEYAQKVLP